MPTIEKRCADCEEKKRTYKWLILGARFVGGKSSLICSACDMVSRWPKQDW